MAITPEELSWLTEDVRKARQLTEDLYCAACGYSLRTRPGIGRCPECGNNYDVKDKIGIFVPQDLKFPFSGALYVVVNFAIGALLVWGWWNNGAPGFLVIGLGFGLMGCAFLRQTYKSLVEYCGYRSLARQIAEDEGGEP